MLASGSALSRRAVHVIGFPKCGTTSLYTYLEQVPQCVGSQRKESRYFYEWIRAGAQSSLATITPEDYLAHAWRAGDESGDLLLEASPDNVYGGRELALWLRRSFVDSKVIAIVRDPVDRLASAYRFSRSLGDLDEYDGFEQHVQSLMRKPFPVERHRALGPSFHLSGGFYGHFLTPWSDVFGSQMLVVDFDCLVNCPQIAVEQIAAWLEIEVATERIRYLQRNKTIIGRVEWIHSLAWKLNLGLRPLLEAMPRLKVGLRELYAKMNGIDPEVNIPDSLKTQLRSVHRDDVQVLSDIIEARSHVGTFSWFAKFLGSPSSQRGVPELGDK